MKCSSKNSELKDRFKTPEGVHRLLTHSEHSRPIRSQQLQSNTNVTTTPFSGFIPMRLSFVTLKVSHDRLSESYCEDKIAFNAGRDFCFSNFRGCKKQAPELDQPIERIFFRSSLPTCHDINMLTRNYDSVEIAIGMSCGQIQIIDPLKKTPPVILNEDFQMEKSLVTCVRWIPGSDMLLLVSFNSGRALLLNKMLRYVASDLNWHCTLDTGLLVVRENTNHDLTNPVQEWNLGDSAIREFAFSPDCAHIAFVVSSGYLHVLDFLQHKVLFAHRSYYGGLLCVTWSPDGRYLLTGGEDDHITVWSFLYQRAVARCCGHRSYVNTVLFDPFCCLPYPSSCAGWTSDTPLSTNPSHFSSYRFGSIGDDNQLLLWDINEEDLIPKSRLRTSRGWSMRSSGGEQQNKPSASLSTVAACDNQSSNLAVKASDQTARHNQPSGLSSGSATNPSSIYRELKVVEPIVKRRMAVERLSALVFKEDCIVVAAFDGTVLIWARPKAHLDGR